MAVRARPSLRGRLLAKASASQSSIASISADLALHLLRRHVADGAHYLASFGLGHRYAIKILCGSRKPAKFREPEVQDFQAAAAGNKDVLRLQIAMNNILLMRRREAVRQLGRQVNRFTGRHSRSRDSLTQGFAFQQFGDNVVNSVRIADVVN